MTTQPNTCPECGMPPGQCYNLCPNSAAYYSPEQERADDATYGDLDRWEGWGDPDPAPDYDSRWEEGRDEADQCLCTGSAPDAYGNRDHIVNPACPTCAGNQEDHMPENEEPVLAKYTVAHTTDEDGQVAGLRRTSTPTGWKARRHPGARAAGVQPAGRGERQLARPGSPGLEAPRISATVKRSSNHYNPKEATMARKTNSSTITREQAKTVYMWS